MPRVIEIFYSTTNTDKNKENLVYILATHSKTAFYFFFMYGLIKPLRSRFENKTKLVKEAKMMKKLSIVLLMASILLIGGVTGGSIINPLGDLPPIHT